MVKSETWNSSLHVLQMLGLAGLMASLPLSNYAMSFSMFWIAGVWLLQVITDLSRHKKISLRFAVFLQNKNAIWLTALFLLPLTGLLWTDDFGYAIWDIRMKLPLLILPFLLTTLNPIGNYDFRKLLGVYILSLTFAVVWCLLIYFGVNPKPYTDVREISVFISHVRFSLMLILGLAIVTIEGWNVPYGKAFTIIIAGLFLFFLNVIASITGFLVLSAIVCWWLLRLLMRAKSKTTKIIAWSAIILVPLFVISWIVTEHQKYFCTEPLDVNKLEKFSSRGEAYDHNIQYPAVENGHYIMTYVAWGELYQGWLERSKIYPDSTDARGHLLKGTIIRYMSAKNLRKDLDGMRLLSDDDIRNIESGMVSPNEHQQGGLKARLNRIFFEWSNFKAGGNPNGHSIIQRLEFWRTGIAIIYDHPWTGVGTGDVKKTFLAKYEELDSKLDPEYRLRAHNQFMTMWITYGVVGFLFLVLLVVGAGIRNRKNSLFTAFIIIAAISFLTEDTLESQAGVMFFGFFFIFLTTKKKISLTSLRPVK